MKISTTFALLLLGLLCLMVPNHSFAATTPGPLNIYVSSAGSDANDGLQAVLNNPVANSGPVATLAEAQRKAVAKFNSNKAAYNQITVNILPGIYKGQSVRWTFFPDTFIPLVIQGTDALNKPIFDGDFDNACMDEALTRSFLTFDTTARAFKGNTYLTVRNLYITHYLTSAISLLGSSGESNFNSGSVIENNTFYEIGSAFVCKDNRNLTSYSALNLTNSRNNIIRDNIFSKISERNPAGSGLHAIYANHFASGNDIYKNNFSDNFSGQIIKLRNQSHGNTIRDNIFINNRNRSAVYNWYCDGVTNTDPETGESRCLREECPNFETTVKNNRVVRSSDLTQAEISNPVYLIYRDYTYTPGYPDNTSCSKDFGTRKRSTLTTNEIIAQNPTKGCFVSLGNCARTGWEDRFDFLDAAGPAQTDANACMARATSWYGSCKSGDTAVVARMAKTRFLSAQAQSGSQAVAHGCVITASNCDRMSFYPQESRLDKSNGAETDQAACLARAQSYIGSCAQDSLSENAILNMYVKAQFFTAGTLKAEKTVNGSICLTQDTERGGGWYYNKTPEACLTICKDFMATALPSSSVSDCRYITAVNGNGDVLLPGRDPK